MYSKRRQSRMKELIEKLIVDLYGAVMNVNDYAKAKEINRNHVNYGVAITCASVLRTLENKVEIACSENDGYLIIENVSINESSIKFLQSVEPGG
jgi:hypothetical protein